MTVVSLQVSYTKIQYLNPNGEFFQPDIIWAGAVLSDYLSTMPTGDKQCPGYCRRR
jgi:hypothetical protein